MKEKMITGVLYSTEDCRYFRVTIENTLEALYELLGVSLIDIVEYQINGKYFDIVVDDEGLLKPNPKLTALSLDNKLTLFGNLFICHHDEEGNLCSLKDDEMLVIPCLNFPDYEQDVLVVEL